ncbi:hypothetical protein BKA62DRAFT_729005 [Auriculariales sp. MPI-PUGE-AT-0066]|nr:hypothetical protein BKA62DRAFT_729005 [Auriculariales sp. MPI-PUGE-AT-0066]
MSFYSTNTGRNSNRGWASRGVSRFPVTDDSLSKEQLLSNTGDVVATFALPEDPAAKTEELVRDFQQLSSYSWVDAPHPKIIVPGSPPIWTPAQLPFTLSQDRGRSYADYHAHRLPIHPLLSIVTAVLHSQSVTSDPKLKAFKFSSLDIVASRNVLRKLLRWIQGGSDIRDFRIDVDLVGETVLLTRREAQTEYKSSGYGKSFEKAMTSHDPIETGHHRIVAYTLDGVRLLVRAEMDACLRPDAFDIPPLGDPLPDHAPVAEASAASSSLTPGFEVVSGGFLIAQSQTIELKSRSRTTWDPARHSRVNNAFSWEKTQHHVLGWHERGTFTAIESETLDQLGQRAEGQAQQGNLCSLAKVLRSLIEVVKKHGERTLLTLVCEGGLLTLRRRLDRTNGALPQELHPLFKI